MIRSHQGVTSWRGFQRWHWKHGWAERKFESHEDASKVTVKVAYTFFPLFPIPTHVLPYNFLSWPLPLTLLVVFNSPRHKQHFNTNNERRVLQLSCRHLGWGLRSSNHHVCHGARHQLESYTNVLESQVESGVLGKWNLKNGKFFRTAPHTLVLTMLL